MSGLTAWWMNFELRAVVTSQVLKEWLMVLLLDMSKDDPTHRCLALLLDVSMGMLTEYLMQILMVQSKVTARARTWGSQLLMVAMKVISSRGPSETETCPL